MNNMNREQENERNSQGQGGRTEGTREGRDTMRGANAGNESNNNRQSANAGQRERGFSSGQTNDMSGVEDEDFDEASLDSDEDEEEMDLGGAEGSDVGTNRNRDQNRDQSARI